MQIVWLARQHPTRHPRILLAALRRLQSPATAYITDFLGAHWREALAPLGTWQEVTPIQFAAGDTYEDMFQRLAAHGCDILVHSGQRRRIWARQEGRLV